MAPFAFFVVSVGNQRLDHLSALEYLGDMEAPSLVFGGFAAMCIAVYGFVGEYPVLTYGDQSSVSVASSIANGDVRPGFSHYGQKRLMAACMQGMTGMWAVLATSEQRVSHARNCLGLALSYTSHTYLEPLTWAVAARASFVLGDDEGMNQYLDYSWHAGRYEQWVAGLRVPLAEEARAVLNEPNKANQESDMALMVMSRSGIAAIADRYWSDLDFRQRITEVVEKLPEADQRRFVSSVRRAARN